MPPVSALPDQPDSPPFRLLDGVRVLDLTTSIAAPYATMLLGDLGAEIVKVERPGNGDDSRAWGPPFHEGESLWYLSVNRNKASITLDFSSEEGLEVLYRLVGVADIVVTNLVPRVQAKLKVDHETLKSVRPDIIFVSLTGFGLTGARSGKSAYDLIAEGYSGVMDITGEAENPPQKVGTPAADLLAGMDAVIGAIAALYDRAKTGNGHVIDISMIESMTRFLTPRIVTYLGSGEVPRRTGARDSVIAIYQAFETADAPITLGLGNNGLWQRFWDAMGCPERGLDERFASNADRHAHRPEIIAEIQSLLFLEGREHWLDLFDSVGIPAGPINRVDEIASDQHLMDRGFIYQMDRDGLSIPQIGLGIHVDGLPSSPRMPPPILGQHTDDILSNWAGLETDHIGSLRARGVI